MGRRKVGYTAIWQEMNRYPDYRIQTNDPYVARKLKKRTTARLVGLGINVSLWIFRVQYESPKLAKQAFKRICGTNYGSAEKDADTGGFIAYTRTILASKSRLEGE